MRFSAANVSGLVEVAGLPDYDSWAGKVSADALEAVGLVPRTQPYYAGANCCSPNPSCSPMAASTRAHAATWRPN
ncbi:MAG: hypothetical protein R3F17_17500 [Planctomycetota bacterium]